LNLAPALNGIRARYRARTILSAILLVLLPPLLSAQESPHAASATIEFATIKPSDPRAQGHRFRVTGRRFETTNTSLNDLISFAYGLHATQIIGAPDWVRSDRFDLTLQAGADPMSETLWTGMLQKYLTESFQLSFHRDTRDLPLYVLSIGRSGSRLTLSEADPNRLLELSITLGSTNAANANLAAISATNATVADLAGVLQRVVLEWPVEDQTGIAGKFDFSLKWTPDGAQFGDALARIPTPLDTANAPPYLPTALEEQMGLTLDVRYAPTQVLVIDHVEKPSEKYAVAPGPRRVFPGRIWNPWRQPYRTAFSTGINPFLVTDDLY
jgi:uncharacterized protein (TIGR03435 family)